MFCNGLGTSFLTQSVPPFPRLYMPGGIFISISLRTNFRTKGQSEGLCLMDYRAFRAFLSPLAQPAPRATAIAAMTSVFMGCPSQGAPRLERSGERAVVLPVELAAHRHAVGKAGERHIEFAEALG